MKRISQYLFLFLLLVLLSLTIPVLAKGPAARITIEGPYLAEPIEITDPDILDRFDPWGGQFIGTGGPLEWPPDVGTQVPYQVFFWGELEVSYVFYYYPDPAGGHSYIYLPGTGEPYYRVNVGTIIRENSDGAWHYALPTWDAAVQDLLPGQSLPSQSGENTPAPAVWPVAVLGVVLMSSIVLWSRRQKVDSNSGSWLPNSRQV